MPDIYTYLGVIMAQKKKDDWKDKVSRIQKWIDEHQQKKFEDTRMTLEIQIKRGNKNKDLRVKAWNMCLLEMRDVDDSTIGGKGAASTLPEHVQEICNLVEKAIIEENTPTTDTKYTKLVTWQTKTSKKNEEGKAVEKTNSPFDSDLARIKAWAAGRIAALKRAYNAGDWDGTEDGPKGLIHLGNRTFKVEIKND